MKTTFSRTLFALAAILLAALLLVGTFFQYLVKQYMQDQAMENLKNDCITLADVAAAYYGGEGFSGQDFLVDLSVISSLSGSDTVICDSRGTLILCSEDPFCPQHRGLVIGQTYLERVFKNDFVSSTGTIRGLYAEPRYVVSCPIRDAQGNAIGIVMASTPIQATQRVLRRLSDTFLLVSLVVVIAAAVVVTIYARKHSSPLREMARAATAFGHGDLRARVSIPSAAPLELQELGLSFNNMADSLEKSEYQRQEFVANVSHELKTPMTTIGGYVDGILDGTIPEEHHRRYLQVVSDETKRLSRLVRSMLDISQLQEQQSVSEEKKTRFDIGECIGQVLISFEQKLLEKNLDVQVDLPEYPLYTLACQDYITRVIYNLLDNAVKFCPREGYLGITLGQDDAKAYIAIANDGPTIPAQELPLLFDRFHKLDKSRTTGSSGWGLGLYIVKTIVCAHGEDISVTSKDGRTEFTFTLPLVN